MATIDPNHPILKIIEPNKADSRAKTSAGEFDSIFRQCVESTDVSSAAMGQTHFISDIRPAQFSTEPMPPTHLIVDRVQRLMDTMAIYQQKLMENGATLKAIQPVMEKMASDSQSLSAASGTEGVGDELRTIVNQSLMLSSMEIAKFRSGYYNDG